MKNWKKLSMFAASALVLAACGNGADEDTDNGAGTEGGDEEQFSIAMVTDTGGINDRSFNQSAWEGMKDWAEENGLSEDAINYYHSEQESQYVPNIQSATTDGYDIVYGIGFLHFDPISEVATQNPDRWYGIVDSVIEMDNVVSLTFRDHENSFLAGMAAALTTETNNVGFVGGIRGEVIDRFETGFTAGVKHVNPDIEIQIDYANSFDDAGVGLQIADTMYQSGADVIFHAAGGVGNGVFQSARNRMEAGSDTQLWVIGVDRDQHEEGFYNDDADNLTLGSTIKNVGAAVGQSATAGMEGNFQGGEVVAYGLAEEGIDFVSQGNISDEDWETINEARQQIIDGEIEVPEFTYSQE